MEMAANAGGFPRHDFRNYKKYEGLLRDETINQLKEFKPKENEVNAMDEIKAELLAEQNKILTDELNSVKEQLAKSQRDANVATTKIAVENALSDAKDLPQRCKKSIRGLYSDAESCDGIEDAIQEQSELVAELKAEFENKSDDSAEVSDLGPTNQSVNDGDTSHEARIEQWLKANNSTDYRAALLATAQMEG
jgi:hypothetical protein